MFSAVTIRSKYHPKIQPRQPSKLLLATSITLPCPLVSKMLKIPIKRAMTAIFHDMMHKKIEDYVDDIVVKSDKK